VPLALSSLTTATHCWVIQSRVTVVSISIKLTEIDGFMLQLIVSIISIISIISKNLGSAKRISGAIMDGLEERGRCEMLSAYKRIRPLLGLEMLSIRDYVAKICDERQKKPSCQYSTRQKNTL
jgi:hypothetical protein